MLTVCEEGERKCVMQSREPHYNQLPITDRVDMLIKNHNDTSIFKTTSEVVGRPLDPCPLVALFGVKEDFVAFATHIARRLLSLVLEEA